MPCESCNTQFTIFKHKKSCAECRRLFCLNCLQKTRKHSRSLCSRCVIFTKRPLTRTELLHLRAKDLIIYLQSKHIPTAGCVEKDDLVNLVLAHVDSMTTGNQQHSNATPTPQSSSNSSSSIPSPGSHYDTFRSYFMTSPPTDSSRHQPHSTNGASSRRRESNTNNNANGGASTGAENAFTFLRQGCQVILENVSDFTNNFKFEAPNPSSPSRSGSSPSSATSPTSPPPASSRQPVPERINTRQPSTDRIPPRRAPPPPPPSSSAAATTHQSQQPPNSCTINRPKPRVPLDTLRHSESGCECSEDEDSKQLRTTSQSTSNLLQEEQMAVPGTSGYRNRNEQSKENRRSTRVPISQSKGSTLSGDSSEFSSFEELNIGTPASATTTALDRQAVNEEEVPLGVGRNGEEEGGAAATNEGDLLPLNNSGGRLITRRRSDSCLNSKATVELPTETLEAKLEHQQHRCCTRCGRKKNELKRRLKRFHDQLTELSTQDVEVRQHLEAILLYLERKRVSVLSQDGESNEESLSEMQPTTAINRSRPVIVNQSTPTLDRENVPQLVVETEGQEATGPAEGEEKKPKVVYKRRFVMLDDIRTSADLEELSVKQLKEILVLNRVDFKGCCEKNELIERVRRLLDDYHACPSIDKLPTDDLCKICMDAPIECVILECGHMATCTNCGKVLSECPICRQFIIRVVRFFRA